ncbi:MAG: hypothetical protein COV48_12130, partial [Elusimicrobia bacterium CG11_big_fil_rev_8_21_14_0_20_64_6]
MRNALIWLAPFAVFVSALAAAGVVETPVTGGSNTSSPIVVPGASANSPTGTIGGAQSTGLGLQSGLSGISASPSPTPAGVTPTAVNSITPTPAAGAVLPIQAVGSRQTGVSNPAVKDASVLNPKLNAQAVVLPGASVPAKTLAPGAKAVPSASSVLDTAAKGIAQGRKAEAAGGDGLSVRQALDRAYDSTVGGADIRGGAGVAGKFSSAREKVASLVGVANNSAPADAPGLYGSAIMTAQETLPAAAAAAVAEAVRSFAAHKADASLSELAQDAYTAATAGQAAESRRLVKSL